MEYTNLSNFKGLLADCMCEHRDSYIIEELFNKFPVVNELMDATEQELLQIKGVGKGKARQIVAMLKLAGSMISPKETTIIRTPNDVFNLVGPDMRYLQKEHFICLFLNTKNHLIFKEVISIGSLNAAIVHPREVFRAAIKRCSASIIAVHNHPSGDPQPSTEDVKLTERLVQAGEIIGIDVIDHLIIGNHSFYSLKENSLM